MNFSYIQLGNEIDKKDKIHKFATKIFLEFFIHHFKKGKHEMKSCLLKDNNISLS